ncbi:hypothetical protein [Streptomyces sp. WMMB 322]|uniref:hypothetical protein n=1 Tax=Streptomyces sp. WMMB 322 TaxID=1286821 RepID=UPI0006E40CB1|nr:hypothetical protein [Streptomyces sp. WMMB 322]SCK42105.1 hypothetical protein H180DRAFT_03653 [Streptomyces sp. WMMB 322]
MGDEPWTIDRIRKALGAPSLAEHFLTEINRAPAHELLPVFAKWQGIAEDTLAAVEQADEILAYEARGEEPPGEWIDGTERVLEAAARIREQGAADLT